MEALETEGRVQNLKRSLLLDEDKKLNVISRVSGARYGDLGTFFALLLCARNLVCG